MALKNDFYSEIFEKEGKWMELLNSGLLNIIYIKYTLKPFYLEKSEQLEIEFSKTNNQIIGQILSIIDNIVATINLLEEKYQSTGSCDVRVLLPEFFTSKMSNNTKENINKKSY